MARKRIGSRAEAELVHRHGIWTDEWDEMEEYDYWSASDIRALRMARRKFRRLMDYGFVWIGNGSYRTAWLSPDKTTVYKRDISDWSDEGGNISEFQNLSNFAGVDLPKGWAIPKFDIFRFTDESIIAMEYIERDSCADLDLDGAFDIFPGISDIHYYNVIQQQGTGIRYLVDAGL